VLESNVNFRLNMIAGEAIAPGLRLKMGSSGTAGQVVIAGDEACLYIAETRAYAQGDPIVVIDIRSPGKLPFVAGGAIAQWAAFTSVAGGKVVTGTGGNEDYGVAHTAAQGDGSQFFGPSNK
jgi:hypothetical protein